MKNKLYIIALATLISLPVITLANSDKAKNTESQGNGQKQEKKVDQAEKDQSKQEMKLLKEDQNELNQQQKEERKAEKQAVKGEDQLAKAKEKALSAIDKRIEKLKKSSERLTNRKRLQEQQRTTISQEVSKAITNLEAAKKKVEAATDVAAVRTILKEAMASVKVNAVIAPKVKAMSMVSALNNAIARLEKVFPKIQESIAKLPADKQTEATKLLNEAKALMPTLKTQTEAAWKEFSLMNSADDAAATKAHLEAGKTSFRQAKDTVKQIVQKLNQIKAMFEAAEDENNTDDSTEDETETEQPEKPEAPETE